MYGNDYSGIASALERAAYQKYAAPRTSPEQLKLQRETQEAQLAQLLQETAQAKETHDFNMDQALFDQTRAEKKGYSGQLAAEEVARATAAGAGPDIPKLLRLASNMGGGEDIGSVVNTFLQHTPGASLDQRANSFLAMGNTIGEGDNYSIEDRDAHRAQQARLDVQKTKTATLNKPLTYQQELGQEFRQGVNENRYSPQDRRVALDMESKPVYETVALADGTTGRVNKHGRSGRVGPFVELYRDKYGKEAVRPVQLGGQEEMTAATASIAQQAEAQGMTLSEGIRYRQLKDLYGDNFGAVPDEFVDEWVYLHGKIRDHAKAQQAGLSNVQAEVPTNAQLID